MVRLQHRFWIIIVQKYRDFATTSNDMILPTHGNLFESLLFEYNNISYKNGYMTLIKKNMLRWQ